MYSEYEISQMLRQKERQARALKREEYLHELEEREKDGSKWRERLKRNPIDGSVKNTLYNINLILCNDERYKDKIEFNEFDQKITYNREDWTDIHESHLKFFLEKSYNLIASIENITHMCNILSDERRYHPIRDYIESTRWDGILGKNS